MFRPAAVVAPMSRRPVTTTAEAAPTDPAEPLVAPSPEPDFAPVIRSKIQPPALRADTLTRERLVKRLDEAVKSRVTLVTADAGYGKTTLLADFAARSGFRALWYRLGGADADSVTWTNYLVAACREADPAFGSVTTRLLANAAAGGPPNSAFIESFLGELSRWQEAPTLLVLDDFHEVDRHAEVAEIVGRLIDDAPEWLHIVISGRRRPSLPLGKLAASAQLAEIGTDDLRFSMAETERLFSDSYSQPLDHEVLEQLDRRTRGWAASLQLFHGSIRGRPAVEVRRLVDELSGAASPLYDFLAEEVLTNVSGEMAGFLVRASVLDRISPRFIPALFAKADELAEQTVPWWIDEGNRLSLLGRTSELSDSYQLHPLLRDFLSRQLETRVSRVEIRAIHTRLAAAMRETEPLTACHHYLEAGLNSEAMACLGASVITTMGSGQWGVASDLIDRLRGVPAGPAVAAIIARRLTSDGNPAAAERLLKDIDLAGSPSDVRAVIRQTWLAVGWRNGDRPLLRATLAEIRADPETPIVLREIAELFIDTGSIDSRDTKPLPQLARRLVVMANSQRQAGHAFYGAVSLHNASVAYLGAGQFHDALAAGSAAASAFASLGFDASELSSTHSILSTCLHELGRHQEAFEHADRAISGRELADVPAELAIASVCLGLRNRALEYVAHAEALTKEGRTDTGALPLVDAAKALTLLPEDATSAIRLLSGAITDWPLDLGQLLLRRSQLAMAHLLANDAESSLAIARPALKEADARAERRAAARFGVLVSIAEGNESALSHAISAAATAGELALAELADVICAAGRLVPTDNDLLDNAIRQAPARWLPALRRQLGKGAPHGQHAAVLLDRHGEFQDVARLRAFAKAYKRRGASAQLGLALARRTSPRLRIQDLGRVQLVIGDRVVALGKMRRKAAALLMFLATQPSFTANKELLLDELWPDADPDSATNSLNQSLYFLRREIDPWYEDEFSVDYVHFAGDLVWLDPGLVATQSADFLREAMRVRAKPAGAPRASDFVREYSGHFAPEFEYEEWAMDWRSKVHSVLLDVAHSSIEQLLRAGDLVEARDVATALLDIDPTASDIERRLIWLLWHLGAISAAKAQYKHLSRLERRDGMEPTRFDDIVDWRDA